MKNIKSSGLIKELLIFSCIIIGIVVWILIPIDGQGGHLSRKKEQYVISKFNIVTVQRSYDTGVGGSGSFNIKTPPEGFKSHALRIVEGAYKNDKKIILVIDPNNNHNPEKTAFILNQK